MAEQKNKGMAIVAYILFFVPLLTDAKTDPYVKFHVKQSLVITIGYFIAGFLSVFLIGFLLYIPLFIFWIMGIMDASNGGMKPLPLVGPLAEKFKF